MTSMSDTPPKVKRYSPSVASKSKWKERVTGSIFSLLVIGLWVAGFRIRYVHAAMAAATAVIVAPLPHWIMRETDVF